MEENVASFRNLEQNLQKQGLSLDALPYVLQFNKRDLPDVAPANYLDYLLNNRKRRVQSFESVASTGLNVFATLDAVTQLLLHKFNMERGQLLPAPGKPATR
jgi:mutual gliding-motility protein MglA